MASITLSREALTHNLDIITQQVGAKDKIAVVLKDNAYGHGATLIAQACHDYGIKNCVVRLEREALEIVEYFDNVLVLADIPSHPHLKCTYAVNALDQIDHFPSGTRVELKVDTGMHRNGVKMEELAIAFEKMAQRGLQCEGVFSHLRSADMLTSEWFWQRKNFDCVKKEARSLADNYGWNLRFHLSNSAGTFRMDKCEDDMVRVGIALYGCLEMEHSLQQPLLKPVLSLWANKIATRVLKQGERIGYNGIYEASEDEIVSTYDLGYANGLNRLASNRYKTPQGIPLRGRISMDNAAFSSDQEKILIFNNANLYAQVVGTIGYEILACLDPNLTREWA